MAKAFYHTEGNEPKEFEVLKTHPDGRVDVGPKGGQAVVTRCEITPQIKLGSCTSEKEPSEPKK